MRCGAIKLWNFDTISYPKKGETFIVLYRKAVSCNSKVSTFESVTDGWSVKNNPRTETGRGSIGAAEQISCLALTTNLYN